MLHATVFTTSSGSELRQWRSQDSTVGGTDEGVWGRKSPSGVQGQSPGRGSGGQSPPEAEAILENEHSILMFSDHVGLYLFQFEKVRQFLFVWRYNQHFISTARPRKKVQRLQITEI